MRYAGRLTDWRDDKGYGSVVPHDGGDRAFVHIWAFEKLKRGQVHFGGENGVRFIFGSQHELVCARGRLTDWLDGLPATGG